MKRFIHASYDEDAGKRRRNQRKRRRGDEEEGDRQEEGEEETAERIQIMRPSDHKVIDDSGERSRGQGRHEPQSLSTFFFF